MMDLLSDRYAELLTGRYDCVDRIVLTAYFRMGHDAGGFRFWWRALTGSDDTLDNTHLMRMAGLSAAVSVDTPRPTVFPWWIVQLVNASTSWPKNIWPRPKSLKGCFSSWSDEHKRRCGTPVPTIIWSESGRCRTSIITRFISSTPIGDT